MASVQYAVHWQHIGIRHSLCRAEGVSEALFLTLAVFLPALLNPV